VFGKKKRPQTLVTESDLKVPDVVQAGNRQAKPMEWPRWVEVNLEHVDVVGESFRQEALDQIGQLTKGGTFNVWLLPEPENKFDKNAVRVMAGLHHIGYIAKEEAKIWSKRTLPLWFESRFLYGEAWGVDEDPVWKGKRGVRVSIFFGDETKQRKAKKNDFDTGWTAAVLGDEEDDSYSLDKLADVSGDPIKGLKKLKELAASESDLMSLHFVLMQLEEMLYHYRADLPDALDEFDKYAEKHHQLLKSQLQSLLISKFGAMPRIPLYRQAAIRHEKAGDFDQALEWTKRGLDIYTVEVSRAIAAEKDFADLSKRKEKLEAKVAKAKK
jgi:hypothetical protein